MKRPEWLKTSSLCGVLVLIVVASVCATFNHGCAPFYIVEERQAQYSSDPGVHLELILCELSKDSLQVVHDWLWNTLALGWEDKFPVKFIGYNRVTDTWHFVNAYPYNQADSIKKLNDALDGMRKSWKIEHDALMRQLRMMPDSLFPRMTFDTGWQPVKDGEL